VEVNKQTEFQKTNNETFKIETYEPIKQEIDQFDFLENQLVILSKETIEKFLQYSNASDLIGLYTFYYYTAKWQKTNQPKCTDTYCVKGLKWSKTKFYKAKKILKDIGLIQNIKRINKENKVVGWYVRINYIWSKNKTDIIQSPKIKTVENQDSGKLDTNALSVNTINALSVNKKTIKNNYNDYKMIYNNILLKIYTQEQINNLIYKSNKQLKQLSLLLNKFKSIEECKLFFNIAFKNKWLKDNGFLPALINGSYDNIKAQQILNKKNINSYEKVIIPDEVKKSFQESWL
jgi:hypothetical protein